MVSWRLLSSDLLAGPSAIFAGGPGCEGVRRICHLQQIAVNQFFNLLVCGTWLLTVQALARESNEQELACRELVDSAWAEIEQRVLGVLANGCSVTTLHIVRID